jgi:hypothetical protein
VAVLAGAAGDAAVGAAAPAGAWLGRGVTSSPPTAPGPDGAGAFGRMPYDGGVMTGPLGGGGSPALSVGAVVEGVEFFPDFFCLFGAVVVVDSAVVVVVSGAIVVVVGRLVVVVVAGGWLVVGGGAVVVVVGAAVVVVVGGSVGGVVSGGVVSGGVVVDGVQSTG